MIQPKNTLGATERLKSRKLIQLLFTKGKSFGSYPLRISWLFLPEGFPVLQAGFTVSKRHFKRSVHRNRIKRLLRESYRLQKHSLQQTLHEENLQVAIFIMFTGKELPQYAAVSDQMKKALLTLEKEISGHQP